mmetsp:Transcript_44430/g.100454  ORF Transcript_44430/g.100454 Transcript_44430/m.100454 type:complete len:284 (+) Transcript_44430:1299-2150(+)
MEHWYSTDLALAALGLASPEPLVSPSSCLPPEPPPPLSLGSPQPGPLDRFRPGPLRSGPPGPLVACLCDPLTPAWLLEWWLLEGTVERSHSDRIPASSPPGSLLSARLGKKASAPRPEASPRDEWPPRRSSERESSRARSSRASRHAKSGIEETDGRPCSGHRPDDPPPPLKSHPHLPATPVAQPGCPEVGACGAWGAPSRSSSEAAEGGGWRLAAGALMPGWFGGCEVTCAGWGTVAGADDRGALLTGGGRAAAPCGEVWLPPAPGLRGPWCPWRSFSGWKS